MKKCWKKFPCICKVGKRHVPSSPPADLITGINRSFALVSFFTTFLLIFRRISKSYFSCVFIIFEFELLTLEKFSYERRRRHKIQMKEEDSFIEDSIGQIRDSRRSDGTRESRDP